ncbi:MAG: hypothetical protein HY913_16800 [Desulfomonile tiedjei]|nr:hypothetical protein [Desulfomonile tiedjei]
MISQAADKQGIAPVPIELVPSPKENGGPSEPIYPAWWGAPPEAAERVPSKDPGKCVNCHDSAAAMDPSHALACVRCHSGDPAADDAEEAHKGLIRDPGDLRTVERTCGRCHPEEARRVKNSAMALAPRTINHTRFAFGGQQTPSAHYATVETEGLKQVPHPSSSTNLGDDLLRRSCLRCHLYTKGSTRWGEHRGQGCSACHVPYSNSADARPEHRLVRNAGITACLKCHNSNHVGSDYVGLFEKDSTRGFASPFQGGRQPQRIYGSEQHRLAADVHFRAGMGCADCHSLDEIHGDGEVNRSPGNRVTISCEKCHVTGDHSAILKSEDGTMTLLRGQGRKVPAWNAEAIPHKVLAHREKLRCSACHASWSFQDYGFHLMLEERPDYWKWAPNAGQNDPQVQEILTRNVGTEADIVPPATGPVPPKPEEKWEPPTAADWLTGEVRPGAWFRGYTVRRWSRPPLGLDRSGKVSVMRPMYQYVVSHVDSDSNLLVDRQIPNTGAGWFALVFNPYEPHTIASKGRACHECHGDPKAIGLGEGMKGIEKPGFYAVWKDEDKVPGRNFRWDALVDANGNPLQRSTHPEAGPLNAELVKRLISPSEFHRAMSYKYLKWGPSGQP